MTKSADLFFRCPRTAASQRIQKVVWFKVSDPSLGPTGLTSFDMMSKCKHHEVDSDACTTFQELGPKPFHDATFPLSAFHALPLWN